MTAMLPLHALALYLLLGEPALGWLAYRRFLRRVGENPAARIRYYVVTVATEWLLVAVLAWGAWLAGISPAALGIGLVRRGALDLGGNLSASLGLGMLAGALIGVVLPIVLARVNAGYREKVRVGFGRLRPLLPATRGQRALFALLSLTAGICEELLYRSFLFWYLRDVSGPFGGLEIALLASGIVFGLAHVYQGIRGVLGTTALGFAFAVLYALTGSIFPSMVLHAAIDLRVLALVGVLRQEPAAATA